MDDLSRNAGTLKAFQDAWIAHDLQALMALVTEDVVFSASVGPEPGQTWVGRVAVREGFEHMLDLDTGTATVEEPVFAGDQAFAGWEIVSKGGARVRGFDRFTFRDGKICLKDAFRKTTPAVGGALSPPMGGESEGTAPYRTRRVSYRGLQQVGGFHIKYYEIEPDDAEAPITAPLREEMAAELPGLVAQVELSGHHHGEAYLLLHKSNTNTWLIFDWWAHGEVVCRILKRKLAEGPFHTVTTGHLSACVWESQVIEHERRAWVETMLTLTPDPDAYRHATLKDGFY